MKKIIVMIAVMVFSMSMIAFAESNKKIKTPASESELKTLSSKYKNKKQHDGLDCVNCHGETAAIDEFYLIKSENCLTCHESVEAVAKRTKQYDAREINPHNSFHAGTKIECYECHAEHKVSKNYCSNCHDIDSWMKKTP